jgi:hypothetical protein
MITDQDVEKLKETFATKEDLRELGVKVDGMQEEIGDLRVEVGEIKDRIDGLDNKFDSMIGLLTASMEEYAMGGEHLARHDRQLAALSMATGVALPD